MPKFTVLGESERPFSPGSQPAVDMLESITAADKAQAVPYVLIWEVDPTSGRALHPRQDGTGAPARPLSLTYVQPPRFGAQVEEADFRFRERPPVSLERISVKSVNPRSVITYRKVELSFVVHRPEFVFEDHIRPDGSHVGNADSWSSLVTPGQHFALEYGWSSSVGVKNGILNGDGFSNTANGILIPGRDQLRFQVTNYSFNITPDSQIRFVIHGQETGEFNLRRAFLTSAEADVQTVNGRPQVGEVDQYANDSEALKKLVRKLRDQVHAPAPKGRKRGVYSVTFGTLFDVVFAELVQQAFRDAGYDLGGVFVGRFNARAGKPARKYSGGVDVSNIPLSDFSFPLEDVEEIFERLIKAGTRLTFYSFLEPFISLFGNQAIWDRSGTDNATSFTIPHVVTRTSTRRQRNGRVEAFFYIFDLNREFTRFVDDDSKKLPREGVKRADVKKVVNSRGVPFVSFVRGNSFVRDANFETVQDEQMKGIFIRRYFGDQATNREQKVGNPAAAGKENRAPAAQQIFSSVINGRVTMLGNFVFDVFSLLWVDFGIRLWDGPFYVLEWEDVVERGDFTRTLNIVSAGTDPLGTQR